MSDFKTFQKFPCVGDLSAVFEENRNHSGLFYHGTDEKIHHWEVVNGKWSHNSSYFSKTYVGGAISAIYNPNRFHSEIFVTCDDGNINYYSFDINWKLQKYLFDQQVAGDLKACFNPISGNPEVIYTSKLGGIQHYFCDIENKWTSISHFEGKPNSPIGITFSDHKKSVEFFYLSYDKSGHYYCNSGLEYVHETNAFSDCFNQLHSINHQVQNQPKMKVEVAINCAYNLPKSKTGDFPDYACEISGKEN